MQQKEPSLLEVLGLDTYDQDSIDDFCRDNQKLCDLAGYVGTSFNPFGELQELGEDYKPLSLAKTSETLQALTRMLVHGNPVPGLKNPQAGASYTYVDIRDKLKAVSFVVAVFVSCYNAHWKLSCMFMHIIVPSLACISYLISYNIAR